MSCRCFADEKVGGDVRDGGIAQNSMIKGMRDEEGLPSE